MSRFLLRLPSPAATYHVIWRTHIRPPQAARIYTSAQESCCKLGCCRSFRTLHACLPLSVRPPATIQSRSVYPVGVHRRLSACRALDPSLSTFSLSPPSDPFDIGRSLPRSAGLLPPARARAGYDAARFNRKTRTWVGDLLRCAYPFTSVALAPHSYFRHVFASCIHTLRQAVAAIGCMRTSHR